jgi:hypothetical protein
MTERAKNGKRYLPERLLVARVGLESARLVFILLWNEIKQRWQGMPAKIAM